MESRWRLIAAVVLVVTLISILVELLTQVPATASRRSAVWDWLYDHHQSLIVVCALAALLLVAIVAMAWSRSSWRTLALGIAPLVVISATFVGWRIADHRSSAGDIADRVHQVITVLPPTASRAAVTEGDNFHTESFVIHDDLNAVARSLLTSARALLSPMAQVWSDPKSGEAPASMTISFTGRNGCDGSVEVNVNLATVTDGTSVDVSGSCED